VCAVLSVFLLDGAPARAGVGDLVDGTVVDAGGGEAEGASQDGGAGPVRDLADSADTAVEETVHTVVDTVKPPSQGSPGGGGDDPAPSPPAQDSDKAVRPVGSPEPHQQASRRGRRPGERASAADGNGRTSTNVASRSRSRVAGRVAGQATVRRELRGAQQCRSGGLGARELRRCARAAAPLPGPSGASTIPTLGGVPVILLPIGLLMIATGLILVSHGRRRRACAGTAMDRPRV
jgi:hypothetical protein